MHAVLFLRWGLTGLIVVLSLAGAGCGRDVDLVRALEPVDVITGWYDAGIVEGRKNKLVPSISLRLRNASDRSLRSVQVNALFRRDGEPEMWGEHYGWAIQREPLQPGDATDEIVLRSDLGYTGEEPRHVMLQHSAFVDARVEIFVKRGSSVWAKLAEFPIDRQLLTQ